MQIRAGLSQLGRTADGLRPAYLKLQVDGTDMATADLVEDYMHLQTLLLRNNELTSLKALGRLDSLTHLDVSGNRLRDVGHMPCCGWVHSHIHSRRAPFQPGGGQGIKGHKGP